MADNPANELRCIAAEIIHKLWKAGETTQLELLEAQARMSIEKPTEFTVPIKKQRVH